MATAAVAAIIEQARREVVSHFLSRNAVSADAAVDFTPRRRDERREFERLQRAEVLKPGRNGSYYLDAPAYAAWQHTQRKHSRLAIGGLIAVLTASLGIALIVR